MKKSEKILKYSIGVLFLLLYMLVATISAICSVDFFNLSHTQTMSICLAVAFELGAMCSLCAGVFMKSNRTLSFGLFALLTAFQMMGNVFHSYTNIVDGYVNWVELFGIDDLEVIAQKRIVSIVSGAILPIVALGFIKCFVDYNDKDNNVPDDVNNTIDINNNNDNKDNLEETFEDDKPVIDEHINKETINNTESQKRIENVETNKNTVKTEPKKSLLKKIIKTKDNKHKVVNVDPPTMV